MFQLPADLFQMFITVDVIASRFGTLLAGMHIIAVALIGAYAMQGRLRLQPMRLVRFALVSLLLLVAVLLGVRAFYTFVFVAPFTKGEVLSGLPLLGEAQPHRVFRDRAEVPPPPAGENGLQRIQTSGVLRACYRRSDYPSAFFNSVGDLVGFDIEMAHRFARQLDARVDFVPVDSIPDAEEQVNSGLCDVFMSLMPMAPEMTLRFAMTAPVVESALGLVVKDHRRREFRTWDAIRALGDVRIATADNLASRRFLEQALPEAEAVLFKDDRDLDDLVSAEPLSFDALLMRAEEGAAWTIRYPQFNLVTPSPILIVPYAYALRQGDSQLLDFLDAWILNARGKGTIDELYRYWMLGQVGQIKPPRWSVIRDVLGWID
jgi:ABC-type amino acid transport substrate-binding protein